MMISTMGKKLFKHWKVGAMLDSMVQGRWGKHCWLPAQLPFPLLHFAQQWFYSGVHPPLLDGSCGPVVLAWSVFGWVYGLVTWQWEVRKSVGDFWERFSVLLFKKHGIFLPLDTGIWRRDIGLWGGLAHKLGLADRKIERTWILDNIVGTLIFQKGPNLRLWLCKKINPFIG